MVGTPDGRQMIAAGVESLLKVWDGRLAGSLSLAGRAAASLKQLCEPHAEAG
jgi:hypothetical protein